MASIYTRKLTGFPNFPFPFFPTEYMFPFFRFPFFRVPFFRFPFFRFPSILNPSKDRPYYVARVKTEVLCLRSQAKSANLNRTEKKWPTP